MSKNGMVVAPLVAALRETGVYCWLQEGLHEYIEQSA